MHGMTGQVEERIRQALTTGTAADLAWIKSVEIEARVFKQSQSTRQSNHFPLPPLFKETTNEQPQTPPPAPRSNSAPLGSGLSHVAHVVAVSSCKVHSASMHAHRHRIPMHARRCMKNRPHCSAYIASPTIYTRSTTTGRRRQVHGGRQPRPQPRAPGEPRRPLGPGRVRPLPPHAAEDRGCVAACCRRMRQNGSTCPFDHHHFLSDPTNTNTHTHTHTFLYTYTHECPTTDVAVRPSPRNPKFVLPLLYPSLTDHEASSHSLVPKCMGKRWRKKRVACT